MSTGPGTAERPLTTPRPGHADLPGMIKTGTHDARDVLERSSARETATRTVVGYLCKQLLATVGVQVISHVVAIGQIEASGTVPGPGDLAAIDASPVRTFDRDAEGGMVAAIDRAHAERDTLGGVVEVLVFGVPPGVGSHAHWDRRLDGLLAGALMSIPAIKAVEIGDGMRSAGRSGSEAHDEIRYRDGAFERDTDRAGGIEGGITTGQTLRMRAAMKPLSTLMRPLALGGRRHQAAGRGIPGTVGRVRRARRRGGGRADGCLRRGRRDAAEVRRGHGRGLRRRRGRLPPTSRGLLSGPDLAHRDDGVGEDHGGPAGGGATRDRLARHRPGGGRSGGCSGSGAAGRGRGGVSPAGASRSGAPRRLRRGDRLRRRRGARRRPRWR